MVHFLRDLRHCGLGSSSLLVVKGLMEREREREQNEMAVERENPWTRSEPLNIRGLVCAKSC